MSGAWGEDPWRRYPYRWHTDRGWTDHVSDGVTEARDTPGARAAAPAASRPASSTQTTATPAAWMQATAAPAGAVQSAFRSTATNAAATDSAPRATAAPAATAAAAATASAATAATAARRQPSPSSPSNAPARWPLAVLGMVLSFALGGWIFGRGDGTEGTDTVSSSPAVVDSTADPASDPASGLMPTDQAANVPTTVPGIVPVATIEPAPGEPPAAPAATVSPGAMSNAELAARNDGLIDDAEFVVVGSTIEQFGWSVPTRDELAMLGWAGCGVAQTAATRDELEAGIEAQMAGSTLPPGQFGVIVGVAAGVMCMDSFVNLGMMPLA